MTEEERILDLLTERLERTLSDDEKRELDRLLAAHPDWRRHDLDFAAAAIHMALDPANEPMPEAVKARVIAKVIGDATKPAPLQLANVSGGLSAEHTTPRRQTGKPRARSLSTYAGWMAAAAAAVLAVIGWWPDGDPDGSDVRSAFVALQQSPNAVKLAWAQTDDPWGKQVGGDVIWDPETQTGFMRFTGIPANNPQELQFQLWIFDAERDERYPVDGGVFDIRSGETIVPIKARVPVTKATLFAVTVEKPGGVVVSKRERIVALAKVG